MTKKINPMKKLCQWLGNLPRKKLDKSNHLYLNEHAGQTVWNDRYGSLQQTMKQWRIAFFTVLVMGVLLSATVAYMATTSKVQPFIVETHEGMPYAIAKMPSISVHDERLINFAINQFIINARTVVKDREAQTALLDKVYAYSANQTLPFLHDYYQQQNPFERVAQATVAISIVSSLPMSRDTWQITWDETEHNVSDGSIIKTTRWVANVTYQLGDVNPHFINDNPFGFYITQLAWTPTLQGVSP